MGKKSKSYTARRKDTRRRAKRHSRKQATSPKHEATADRGEHELVTDAEGDSASGTCSKDTQEIEIKQSKELIALHADHDRVCQMLYEEQRKPRKIYLECARCVKQRRLKAELARQSLHSRMFSGESLASKQLLAALRYHF